ncbi:hypothetical protein Dimus_028768 [Dionaea muscipula]
MMELEPKRKEMVAMSSPYASINDSGEDNRMRFGVLEESSLGDGLGEGYGMLGQVGSGKSRISLVGANLLQKLQRSEFSTVSFASFCFLTSYLFLFYWHIFKDQENLSFRQGVHRVSSSGHVVVVVLFATSALTYSRNSCTEGPTRSSEIRCNKVALAR